MALDNIGLIVQLAEFVVVSAITYLLWRMTIDRRNRVTDREPELLEKIIWAQSAEVRGVFEKQNELLAGLVRRVESQERFSRESAERLLGLFHDQERESAATAEQVLRIVDGAAEALREFPSRTDLQAALQRMTSNNFDLIKSVEELVENVEDQRRSSQVISEQLLGLSSEQGRLGANTVALLQGIANAAEELRRESGDKTDLNSVLQGMTKGNLDLLNQEDDSALRQYVASEMLLGARLHHIEDDLINMPVEDWKRLVRGGKLQGLLEWMKRHKVGDRLLGKINDLAKGVLGRSGAK